MAFTYSVSFYNFAKFQLFRITEHINIIEKSNAASEQFRFIAFARNLVRWSQGTSSEGELPRTCRFKTSIIREFYKIKIFICNFWKWKTFQIYKKWPFQVFGRSRLLPRKCLQNYAKILNIRGKELILYGKLFARVCRNFGPFRVFSVLWQYFLF